MNRLGSIPFLFGLLLILSLPGCGGSESRETATATVATSATSDLALPGPEEAKSLISGSPEFGDYRFTRVSFSLPMKGSMMNDWTHRSAEELAAAGWIRLDEAGDVTLTDRASSDKRFLVRENGFVELVPLASKEMLDVVSVQPAPNDQATVLFDWKWIPNDLGEAFQSGTIRNELDQVHHSKATLMEGATGWEILLIEPAETAGT